MNDKEFEFAVGKTVARMYEKPSDAKWPPHLIIEFRDGSGLYIESSCDMSYGDHPCPSREMPEVEYFVGPETQTHDGNFVVTT
jgi:hypothetical protein